MAQPGELRHQITPVREQCMELHTPVNTQWGCAVQCLLYTQPAMFTSPCSHSRVVSEQSNRLIYMHAFKPSGKPLGLNGSC